MNLYLNCPRCQGEWKKCNAFAKQECINCHLRQLPDNGFCLHSFLELGDRLYWFSSFRDDCLYFNALHNNIKLPLLPFNITSQTLKTLLIFS